MPLFVHITPENKAKALRRNGISPTRLQPNAEHHPEFHRIVWACPVLPSTVLTHSWARELKRWGAAALGCRHLSPATATPPPSIVFR